MKKYNLGQCPTGLNDPWDNFPWQAYPGGVDVTFVLTRGKSIFLLKEGRHCLGVTKVPLKQGQVLADLISQVPGGSGSMAEVCANHDDGRTFQVLVMVRWNGPVGSMREFSDDALLLGGYVPGNVMAAYAAHVLGWRDADRHLPLPLTTLAEAA